MEYSYEKYKELNEKYRKYTTYEKSEILDCYTKDEFDIKFTSQVNYYKYLACLLHHWYFIVKIDKDEASRLLDVGLRSDLDTDFFIEDIYEFFNHFEKHLDEFDHDNSILDGFLLHLNPDRKTYTGDVAEFFAKTNALDEIPRRYMTGYDPEELIYLMKYYDNYEEDLQKKD